MNTAKVYAVLRRYPGWQTLLTGAGVRLSVIDALDAHADRMADFEREQERAYWDWWRSTGRDAVAGFIRSEQPKTRDSRLLTADRISRARLVPIAELMETDDQGYAACPFTKHKRGKKFSTKNGIGYCYDCREKPLDAIGYLTRIRGYSFAQAVQELAP